MTRQDEIVAYIARVTAQRRVPPSMREIAAAVGLASKATVSVHLANAERDGKVERVEARGEVFFFATDT